MQTTSRLVVLFFLAFSLQISFGQDSFVNPFGSCGGTPCFMTISAAVAAASPGDVIQVENGTYNENVNVNKSLTLQSANGAGTTSICGSDVINGTVFIASGVNNVTVQGFTIKGYDGASAGLEKAAVYIQGHHTNISILNNVIVADGEAGLLEEYGGACDGLIIDGNTFSGKTFVGPEPAGCGFSQQFTLQNVPRQLATVQGGSDQNVQFTNNMLIGTTGGYNSNDACDQGNNLATIDATNVTITGNMFSGTTSRFASMLRARGSNTSVSGNTFDGTNLEGSAIYCFFDSDAFTAGTPGTIEGVVAANTFSPEAGYSSEGNFYIFPCSSAPAPDVEGESKEFCQGAPAADRRITVIGVNPTAPESVVWVLQSAPAAAGYTAGQEFDVCDGSYNDGTLFLSLASRRTIRVESGAPAGTYTFKVKIKNCNTGCETDLAESLFSLTKYPAGLYCDFLASPDNVSCESGSELGYEEGSGTFTLISEGCYEPGYYRMNDAHGFAGKMLCGNGEIIAQVTGVSGGGWAGITMREGLGASDRMLQLMIDGSFLTRREMRLSSPGMAFTHQFQTQGKNWLRLTRSGNTFSAAHSSDGVNWSIVITTNIGMSSCIHVGLITMDGSSMGTTIGTFQNVSISGGAIPLSAPNPAFDIAQENPQAQSLNLFPNPATDEVNVKLHDFIGQEATISIFNVNGQVVQQLQLDEVYDGVQNINVNALDNGTYLMRIESAENVVSKKFIIAGK